MISEKWDILDGNGIPTGKTTLRGRCFLRTGEYHLVVHIWVLSKDGRLLIQRRADSKKLMPGEWAATGGAAIAGEDSFSAARRELFEELSIPSNETTLKKIARIKRRNSLVDVWLTVYDSPAEMLTLQKSEVAEVKRVTLEELKEMIKEGKFHNYGSEYFSQVFDEIENFKAALCEVAIY